MAGVGISDRNDPNVVGYAQDRHRRTASSGVAGAECNRPAYGRYGRREPLLRRESAMDGSRFDAFTRLVGTAGTRRTALRSALGAAAASTGAVVGLAALSERVDAKKHHHKKCNKDKKCKPQAAGSLCSTNKQCCTNETNRICALASGFDQTICCGGTGAPCTTNDNCCRHFNCVAGACRD